MFVQKKSWEHTPMHQLIPPLALPTVVAMISTSVYQLTDLWFGASLGTKALAGMGLVFSLYAVMQAVGYTVALGGSTWVSVLLGKGHHGQVAMASKATLRLGWLSGIIMAAVGVLLAPYAVRLLGGAGGVKTLGVMYAYPILLSAPFVSGGFCYACLLRTVGKAVKVMVGIVAGSAVKLVATPLLLVYGVAGIGCATLLGQGVTCVTLWLLYGKAVKYRLCKSRTVPLWAYGKVIWYGMSSLFRQGTVALATALCNRLALPFGAGVVAAVAIAGRIGGLVYSAFLGWGQGYQPVAGYFYGKGDEPKVKQAFGFTLWTGTVAMTAMGILCWVLAPPLATWFGAKETQTVVLAVFCLRFQALAFPFIPLGVLTNMTFQSMEKPVVATLLACCRQGLCFIPLLYILSSWFGVKGVLASFGAADLLTFVVSLLPLVWLLAGRTLRFFFGS